MAATAHPQRPPDHPANYSTIHLRSRIDTPPARDLFNANTLDLLAAERKAAVEKALDDLGRAKGVPAVPSSSSP